MIIFHHVPKTAGSTFHHAVVAANPDVSCMIGSEGLQSEPDRDFSRIRYLGGHIPFDDAKTSGLDQGNIHVSLLRDPIRRIVSHFEMAFRDDDVFREEICRGDKWGLGFEVFYERFIVDEGLVNLHCKYFSKKCRFYDAVAAIVMYFQVVGIVDDFDSFRDATLAYFDELGLKKPEAFPVQNKSGSVEDCTALIDAGLLERIKRENVEDFRLYSWLKYRHEGLYVAGP
jgi:hypothetical protein